MKEYVCPLDECDYAAGTAGSVRGHLTGETSGEHRGMTSARIGEGDIPTRELDDGHAATEPTDSGVTDDEPEPTPDDPPDDDLDVNTPQFPDATDSADTSNAGGCPECGGELTDLPPNRPVTFEDGTTGVTEPGDELCEECEGLVSDGEVFY